MRELIAFDETAIPEALRKLVNKYPDIGAVLLSTCNRVEFYLARPVQGHPRIEEVIDFLSGFHGIEPGQFAEGLYSYEDTEAVRHLFRVVSSLDSMVLGESQILAQAKWAYETAREAGSVGKKLDVLFQQAFRVAKDIHTQTAIATGRVSVGSTAVDLAQQIFSHFDDKTVMMVGAGKMGGLTLTHLLSTRPKRLLVTNRTDSRAVELAEKLSARHNIPAEPVGFADWIDRLADVDIVITSTGSRDPILNQEQFAPIPEQRKYRSLLLIDIAVPRDIDEAVGEYDNVFLYNIDDLQSVTELNLAQRAEAIDQCQKIIEANVIEFVERIPREDIGPLIAALQKYVQDISDNEWNRILPKLENASDRDREMIKQMLHRVSQKFLHDPLDVLKSQTGSSATHIYTDTLRTLFNLRDDKKDSE
jgi:glutamyl-tRNA reductase